MYFPNNVFQSIFTEILLRDEGWMTNIRHRRTYSTSELRCQGKPELEKGSNTHIFQSELEQGANGFHRATIFHVDFQFQISLEMTLT